MDKTKLAVGISLVAVVIAIIACFLPVLPNGKSVYGSVATQDVTSTNLTQLTLANGLFVTNGGISNGGVQTITVRQSLVSGTSTPCVIQNPFTATSTVQGFQMNITTATSSAITWAIGTSTTAYATSTSMNAPTVAAGAQATLGYSPLSGNVIAGSNYVIAGSGSGTTAATGAFATGIILGGTCQATFQSAS